MMQIAQRLAISFVMCFVLTAQAQSPSPQVKFVTSAGEFVVEVYPDKTPKTVENFLGYVRDGHYNGTLFHQQGRIHNTKTVCILTPKSRSLVERYAGKRAWK